MTKKVLLNKHGIKELLESKGYSGYKHFRAYIDEDTIKLSRIRFFDGSKWTEFNRKHMARVPCSKDWSDNLEVFVDRATGEIWEFAYSY